MCPLLLTIAQPVSSHDVSMPKITVGRLKDRTNPIFSLNIQLSKTKNSLFIQKIKFNEFTCFVQ